MLEFISVFFGPIFAKELVEMSRRWRYYLSRIVYGLALLLVLIFVALDHTRAWWSSDLSIKEAAALANAIFLAVSILQYAAVFVFVPLFLCGVISGEREERTLEMLFTTHLTNRQIVLSKLASRLFVVTLLILSALPVFSLIMLFGGVDPTALLMNTAATLLALLFVGSMSIFMSATTKSPLGALIRTYGWLLIWLVAVPLLIVMLAELWFRPGAGPPPVWVTYLGMMMALLHPVFVFVIGMNPFLFNQVRMILGTVWFYPAAYVLPTLVSFCLLWRASRRLRVEPKTFRQRFAWLGLPWRWLRRRRIQHGPVQPSTARRRRIGREVANPFWQRSRRVRIYDREGYVAWIQWVGWVAAAGFFVLFLVLAPRALRAHEASYVWMVPTAIGLGVLTVLVSASSIVGDRRRGFFELALTTPVTPREVVDGTLLAVWQHVRPACVLMLVLGVTFVLTGASRWNGMLMGLVSAALFLVLLALVGIGCSLAARSYVGALVPTILYVIALNVGLAMMIGLFRQASGPVLWCLAAGLMLLAGLGVRRQSNPVLVALLFLAFYLVVMSLATFWTFDPNNRNFEYPVCLTHPGFLIFRPLDGPPESWFDRHWHWLPPYLFFWSGLIINILFVRWWLIQNFNRLVGRSTGQRAARPKEEKPRTETLMAAGALATSGPE